MANALNNPYEKGSKIHQDFQGSLNCFSRFDDERLNEAMEQNSANAKNCSTYNFEQLDYFERECRAIQTVMESRK